ncbi:predicted protein [Verticillium alfalfae VaMs.102]|uniref:Predicted protein n=1 Tax=Verticillium alfalfae (strain VaMs.102 / ATCC MYA-4576 / FGSC 10136) TaxID=526221 RepID=C9SU49_VERA1|nr:predicted protein [Verticillium alfalfae VaMs.102]EEY22360.1 predicted protein [Verticillium alfalfae VaMs.102]
MEDKSRGQASTGAQKENNKQKSVRDDAMFVNARALAHCPCHYPWKGKPSNNRAAAVPSWTSYPFGPGVDSEEVPITARRKPIAAGRGFIAARGRPIATRRGGGCYKAEELSVERSSSEVD